MSEEEELRRIISVIKEYSIPQSVLLFGSRATDKAHDESDFDICVIYERLPKRNVEVMQDLYRSFFKIEGHAIDLVVYESKSFQKKAERKGSLESVIRREGQVIYG